MFKDKHDKYGNKCGIRIENDAETNSKEPFRFIPLLFTVTGLYRPSLFRDLTNILKLPPKTVSYLLHRLSALSIKGTRLVWITYTRIATKMKLSNLN